MRQDGASTQIHRQVLKKATDNRGRLDYLDLLDKLDKIQRFWEVQLVQNVQ